MSQPAKLFIAVPAYGQIVQSHCAMSLFRLGQHLQAVGIPAATSTVSFPDIVDVRNIFLTLWYDHSDASHLLFVDADMDFESQMVIDMVNFDQPLVGAIYPARVLPTKFVGRAGNPSPVETVNRGFLKVDGVGAGIMLIRRDCVTKLLEANPELSADKNIEEHTASNLLIPMGIKRIIHAFDPFVVNGIKRSEDLSFCQRWRELGNDIWANVVYEIGHSGTYRFSGRYIDLFKTEPPSNENNKPGCVCGRNVECACADKDAGPSAGLRPEPYAQAA